MRTRALALFFLLAVVASGCGLRPAARASAEPASSSKARTGGDGARTSESKPPEKKRAASSSSTSSSSPPRGTVLEGKASYYSDSLAGRSTASGAPYDPKKLTAAHLTLKFGTRLRVTRVDTGASVVVTVNDRGPYGNRGRIVDLSRKAAEKLDMIRRGVVDVRVEILGED